MRPRTSLAALAVGLALLGTSAAHAAAQPTIQATWVTAVSATSADLHAEVDSDGFATSYRFEYIAEAAYRANPPGERFAGAARVPPGAEASLTGAQALQFAEALQPATAYRYRILAHSHCNPAEPAEICTAAGSEPPGAFTTAESGAALALLDRRGWEVVSPVDKNGGAVQGFGQNSGGDLLQAAANGEAATFSSSASFGEGAAGAPVASQYLSRRTSTGWSTQNITTPILSGSYGDEPEGVPYRLFSTDLSAGLMLNGEHCRGSGAGCPVENPPLPESGAPPGYQDYYLRDDEDGAFAALLTEADLAGHSLSPDTFDLRLAGATPDLSHIVLSTCAALTSEATEVPGAEGCEPAETNLYEWSGGALRLINVLPGQSHGAPDAHLAVQSGAISTDGSRVYFTDGEDSAIYLARAGEPTVFLPETVGGGATFQTASANGAVAFFTVGGELFRYATATATSEPLAGGVKGVLGASQDGTSLYYETAAGLFLWRAGDGSTEIAAAGAQSDWPPATGTARVSADGARLLFLSAASLTGYDNTDQQTGEPDTEVYLYEAPAGGGGGGTLLCASCNPTGERPLGPSTIPGAIANGEGPQATDSYKPRDLSASGRRAFFDSADALVPQDTDNRPDVYEWEAQGEGTCAKAAGCLELISSGRSAEGASFVDASESGRDAFFLTDGSLVPQDSGSTDLYDARENGGFPVPATPIECDGDACQPLPSEPEDPTPGTLLPGPPNPPVSFPKTHHHKPKANHHKRGHRHHHRSGRGRIR